MAFDFSVVQDSPVRNVDNPTVIRVIGCGGGGSNAIRQMIQDEVQGVEFVVLNTDLQALNKNPAQTKLPIGQKITGGLGSGGNPEVGEKAAIEDTSAIEQLVSGSDMVVLTAGMGGGTGTGSIPVVAQIARNAGALTIAVVTTPFEFEGPDRMANANHGIEKLRENVDSLIVIPNESVFKIIDKDSTFVQAFQEADKVLCQGMKGICEIITKEGIVNRDFNDMKTVLKDAGPTLLGVGEGVGENRAIDAAQMAISNPMLEHIKIDGASKLLVNITGPADIKMSEINEINNTITAGAAKNHHNLWGQIIDPTMEDKVRVIVIATGFKSYEEEQLKVEENVKIEETRNDPNVVSSEDFAGMFGGLGFTSSKPVNDSASSTEKKSEGSTLGNDLFGGSFESVKPSYANSENHFSMPSNYSSMPELERPACLRKQERENNYSKTINLSGE